MDKSRSHRITGLFSMFFFFEIPAASLKDIWVNSRGQRPSEIWKKSASETLTNWRDWHVLTRTLKEAAENHEEEETKVLQVTEMEPTFLLFQKKRDGRYLERAEFYRVSHQIWGKRRVLKREKHLTKIKGECRDGESVHENTKEAFQPEVDQETGASQEVPHKVLPRLVFNPCTQVHFLQTSGLTG